MKILAILLCLIATSAWAQVSNQQALSQVGATHVRTAAEIAAGVTPTNYGYLPGNVRRYGADPTQTNDSTAAIQAALSTLTTGSSVYVPAGRYKFSALIIPAPTSGLTNFTIRGDGPSSVLVQTGTGITFASNVIGNVSLGATLQDLAFDGTAGTGHTINTSYVQVLDLRDLYFTNVPVGFASLKLDGNPGASVYMHDVRLNGIRIYSTTAGNAGIELGPWASDTRIDRFIMNGNFVVNYCLLADANAQTTVLGNSHPYNAKINVVKLSGTNNNFGWNDVTFDNALADIFYSTGSTTGRFVNSFFEAIPNGFSGVVFDNSYNNTIVVSSYTAKGVTATSAVRELNGSSGNKVIGGTIDSLANYTTPFNLSGSGSYAKGLQNYNSYDSIYTLAGTAAVAQAQSTATNYGANTAAGVTNAAWAVPLAGYIRQAAIFTDSTPAAGQTFTFNLQKNGSTVGTGVINNGSFGVTITLNPNIAVSPGDTISIQSVFSATSGSASPRYTVTLSN